MASDLFLLYINDILKHSKIILFADDTLLFISGKNVQEQVDRINEDLTRVNVWLSANKLKINTTKTKHIVFSCGKNADLENVCIVIDGTEIERVR